MAENEKVNWVRAGAGVIYLVFGAYFYYLWHRQILDLINETWLWCASWSSFGIGAWLINTRDHNESRDRKWYHYVLYFPFALVVVSFASLTLALYASNENWKELDLKFRSLAAFVGLVLGFLSEHLYPLSLAILQRLTKWGDK